MIIMVDGSSDVVQLETARKAMQDALSDPQLSGLPILLLVTHQDRENCRSFLEVLFIPPEIRQTFLCRFLKILNHLGARID